MGSVLSSATAATTTTATTPATGRKRTRVEEEEDEATGGAKTCEDGTGVTKVPKKRKSGGDEKVDLREQAGKSGTTTGQQSSSSKGLQKKKQQQQQQDQAGQKKNASAADDAQGDRQKNTKAQKKKKKKKKLNLAHLDQEGDAAREWPRRLLVLDVNGVLVSRNRTKVGTIVENYRDPLGFHVYDRPHMRELLHWARHKRGYALALWTSATTPVAQGMAKHIFAAPKFQLEQDCAMVLDQTACGRKGRTAQNTPNFVKPLERIWLDPRYRDLYTAENTLILDNEESKTALNASNAVHVTTFAPIAGDDADDFDDADFGKDGALWKFLDALARESCDDVRAFLKLHPLQSFRA